MKTFVLACLFVVAATAVFMPTHSTAALLRQRRDVAELSAPSYNYLPPMLRLADTTTTAPEAVTDAQTEAPLDSAILGKNGYEYKTVRRLKYRNRSRRDVSHLPQNEYLPPPSNEYLPPQESTTAQAVMPAEPKLANEYLPPAAEITETESPAAVEEQETETPAVQEEEVAEEAEVKEASEETAILAEDGYHYKQPASEPPQLKLIDAEAYLPPVVEDAEAIVVEGPAESAVLADDGYHYRTVKRYRF